MSSSPASEFATALLGELIRRGIRDVVLSPGSRSQALALAAAAFERDGMLRLRVRIDERSAGFLALGLAVESRVPVAVITTSGTAVAELHPAVLEAAHSGVPLLLLTADRPAELIGIGANQATVQPGIFGGMAKLLEVEAPVGGEDPRALVDEMLDGIAGPVHVNIAFREPLSGPTPRVEERPAQPDASRDRESDVWVSRRVASGGAPLPAGPDSAVSRRVASGGAPLPAGPDSAVSRRVASGGAPLPAQPGTVVVAGAGAGPEAEAAARALGAPLLAEVTSGARFGPNLVAAYRELLNEPEFGGRVERVIVFGHPTLSREVPALIERDGVETVVVRSPGIDDYNPGHRVSRFVDGIDVQGEVGDESWPRRWVHASRQLLAQPEPLGAGPGTPEYAERAAWAREALAEQREPVTRRMLVEAVWRASWPHDRLVLGASRLIRELDRVAPGKKIPVHANRGLAGIDGTIATATGIALASGALTRVLLGDLALLHDAGSLLAGDGEPRPPMQVIVGNDGGGTIFDGLEVASSADPGFVDRVLLTPQTVDLAALASAYGWQYTRVETRGELDPALTPTAGQVLIEVPLSRQ